MCILCRRNGQQQRDKRAALLDLKLLQLFDVLYSTRSVTRAADDARAEPTDGQHLARQAAPAIARSPVRAHAGRHATHTAAPIAHRTGARNSGVATSPVRSGSRNFTPATAQRRFRICMTDASHITLLPQLLAHVRAVAPLVRLEALAHRRQHRASAGVRRRRPRTGLSSHGSSRASTSRRYFRRTGCAWRTGGIRESARRSPSTPIRRKSTFIFPVAPGVAVLEVGARGCPHPSQHCARVAGIPRAWRYLIDD